MTLYELIQEQAQRLTAAGVSFGHGTTNAFDEAAWLVLWSIHIGFDQFEYQAQRIATAEECQKAQDIVDRRIQTRKPAAYLTQEAWLQNVPFYVDERSIVPRSFIAELLADGDNSGQLDAWLSDETHRVLDMCTGNGSLAVIAAMAYPDIEVDGADLSADALEVAKINVQRHRLESRIHLMQSNLFESVRGPYDLILCNPPYVNASSMSQLPPEYLHEPTMALAGGDDGMNLIRSLLNEAPRHLSPKGVLVLEIGNERAHFERAFPRLECSWMETSAGDDQVLLLTRSALLARTAAQAKNRP